MDRNLSYLLRRASEERTAALHSPDQRVRRVHLEMAERYEQDVRQRTLELREVDVPLMD